MSTTYFFVLTTPAQALDAWGAFINPPVPFFLGFIGSGFGDVVAVAFLHNKLKFSCQKTNNNSRYNSNASHSHESHHFCRR